MPREPELRGPVRSLTIRTVAGKSAGIARVLADADPDGNAGILRWSGAGSRLLGEPEKFFTAPGYEGWPLVLLRLAEVDPGRLAELVTDAWRMRAPEPLASDLGEAGDLPGAGPG